VLGPQGAFERVGRADPALDLQPAPLGPAERDNAHAQGHFMLTADCLPRRHFHAPPLLRAGRIEPPPSRKRCAARTPVASTPLLARCAAQRNATATAPSATGFNLSPICAREAPGFDGFGGLGSGFWGSEPDSQPAPCRCAADGLPAARRGHPRPCRRALGRLHALACPINSPITL